MATENRNERDLILSPNEYAFILDQTKGHILNYVGPHKTSLANTDQPVVFDITTKKFKYSSLADAIQTVSIAPEGWYLVVKNPSLNLENPNTGSNSLPKLSIGKKVNIPGPTSFTPWPGQMVKIIQGHHLRSNQYLLIRVYDEEAAKTNWKKAVIKLQSSNTEETKKDEIPDLTMGKLLIIKGTEVSFYIPPTGIEVIADEYAKYVRDAVTLERLEYCILLDENGNKTFIQGPDVVFPKPTETFVIKDGSKKFKAMELNEISGIYVKVIAPYEENGKKYNVGDELFITGKDQMIYFPRTEHAIVRYGDKDVIYAVAIPEGEARYVLNRITGEITLKKGPAMFLPDPRCEIIVRRVLEPKLVELWFPGNKEALDYNSKLLEVTKKEKGEYLEDADAKEVFAKTSSMAKKDAKPVVSEFVGDQFTRTQKFTPPRTITLDTKYEGAVCVNAWTGYAFLVVSKKGTRKVVVGPKSYLLEYDETLEPIELSTGTPKNDKILYKTVYLRSLNNKVSDLVEAETLDFCEVNIKLSYRVNFEGEPEKWFNVENYVKFLTDHMRSLLRNVIRRHEIEDFYKNAITIVRDAVLGKQDESGKRKGRVFEENGMKIYDVEVLDVVITDDSISKLLIEAQHNSIKQTLELTNAQKNYTVIEEKEVIAQKTAKTKSTTQKLMIDLQQEETKKQMDLSLAKIEATVAANKKQLDAKFDEQDAMNKINTEEISREKAKSELQLSVAKARLNQQIENLKAEVDAVVKKAEAISPEFISALQSFSDKALAEKMAESMSPLAILGGKSVSDVLSQLLKGTVLENVLLKKDK